MSLIHEMIKFGGFTSNCKCSGETGGGATTWEDLGSTYGEGFVLPECNPMYVSGQFVFTEAFPLVEGKEYTVNWNGTPYKCICIPMAMGSYTGLGLGNIGALTGGTNTGEPFCLGVFDQADAPFPGAAMPLDGTTSLTISITANLEKITPVPEKYLPTYDWNADEGEPGHILNRTHYKEDRKVVLKDFTFTSSNNPISIHEPIQFIIGEEYEMAYIVEGELFGGGNIKATAEAVIDEGVQKGVGCNFGGVVSVISALPAYVFEGVYGLLQTAVSTGLTISLTVYKSEKIKQLDPEFIPKSIIPHYNLAELGMNPIEVGNFQNLQYDDFPDGKFNEIRNAFATGPVSITVPVVGSTGVYKYRLFCLGSYMVRDDGTPDNRIYAIAHDPDYDFYISVWDNYISVRCG